MEQVAFLIVAVVLYFSADWILRRIERARGSIFEHRTIIFFFMLMAFALIAFELIERFVPK